MQQFSKLKKFSKLVEVANEFLQNAENKSLVKLKIAQALAKDDKAAAKNYIKKLFNDEKVLNSIFEKAVLVLSEKNHREILNKWVSVKFDKSYSFTNIFEVLILILIVGIFIMYRQYLLKKQNAVLKKSNKEFEHLINSTIEALFISEKGKLIEFIDISKKYV